MVYPQLCAGMCEEELKEIRSKLPKEIIDNSVDSGVEIVLDPNGNIDELYKFTSLKNKTRKKRYYQGLYNNFSKNNAVDIFFINVNCIIWS